ncbi:FG-GAP-like repeat-containing protein [Streptomyces glaucosporus]|uniref:FG-GAP-like repeat-containing protein n=1 Tax=Streptomyces glaucosporus TaxID=284044 RepID=A0ABP5UR30_9ACTN
MRPRPRTRLTAVLAASAALLATAPLTAASTAYAAPVRLHDDLNGDGHRDLVVGAPGATVDGVPSAGAVVVLYGSADGLSGGRRTVIHQNSPGIPGTAEDSDRFGASVATGDLDGDGLPDLVVGAGSEAIGTRQGVGSVTVVWGSAGGLGTGTALPQPAWREHVSFGENLAVGDFTGDGALDLTVAGRDGPYHYTGPFARDGESADRYLDDRLGTTHNVISGDLDGDGRAERVVLPGPVDGDPNGDVYVDRFVNGALVRTELPGADGEVGSIGDIDGDGYGDLVLGASTDPGSGETGHLGGQISVWYGGPGGPDPKQRPQIVHQDTPGVPGASERADAFGSSVAVGDVDGDGHADVAAGAFLEDLSGEEEAGSVTVLYGSADGLTADRAVSLHQDTAGVPGAAEAYDYFGRSVRLADLTGDGRAELSSGVPGENSDQGYLQVFRGASSGVSASGVFGLAASGAGLSGQAWLGHSLLP